MNVKESPADAQINKTITIKAHPSQVWEAITRPELIRQWMGEPEMETEISTDWKVGNPVVVKGFHHVKFQNEGIILQVEPERLLTYTYLSSLSHLPNKTENHTVIEFRLTPSGNGTSLSLTLHNFPTMAIFKHAEFYWGPTLEIIRRLIEGRA